MWWDFKVIHVPGIRQEGADAISRRQTPKSRFTVQVSGILDLDDTATLRRGIYWLQSNLSTVLRT